MSRGAAYRCPGECDENVPGTSCERLRSPVPGTCSVLPAYQALADGDLHQVGRGFGADLTLDAAAIGVHCVHR